MKYFFALSLAMVMAAGSLFSQEDTLKARSGDWGVTLSITGLFDNIGLSNSTDLVGNNMLQVKRFLEDDKVLRLGFGIKVENLKWETADSVGQAFVENDSTFQRNSFSITPGFEKHFGSMKRLDPYVGIDLPLGIVGRTQIKSDTKTTEAIGESTLQRIIQVEGGIGFAVRGVVGFNYFLSERLSLGTEYSFGYSILSLGGNVSESIIDDPASGTGSSTFKKSTNKTTENQVNVNGIANLHLSFFF